MSLRILGIALVLTLLGAADARAFDGRRQGFVLGFGAGPGKLIDTEGDFDVAGVQTDLKIGSGINDRTIIQYTGKQFWHTENSIFYTQAFPMLGVTRYLKPTGPSAFVSGAAGASILAFFTGEEGGLSGGIAAYAGGGYELARHWNVEIGVIGTWPEGVGLYDVHLTINVLGY